MDVELREWVQAAAGRLEVREAVGRVYADLREAIDSRKPLCVASGRCCRFDQFGHRLFITTMELGAFVHDLWAAGKGIGLIPEGGCPFQVGKLCGVHAFRPMGCRIFFCDPTSKQWQQDQYERLHGRLKGLHASLNVPYLYMEWRAALAALGMGL